MLIQRDIIESLKKNRGVYAQILLGPRQCGKSTLLGLLGKHNFTHVTFDDLQIRQLAQQDPAWFLQQYPPPIIIDEAQYAPNIFPEIKKRVDELKLKRLKADHPEKIEPIFRLTGSNQIVMDRQVKESLVGRASYFDLNTLSVHEILQARPNLSLPQILFQGGWPELYINPELEIVLYLNDYIRSYIEKDIILSAGITKQHEFYIVLGMLAARTGQFLSYSSIAKDAGVKSVTVTDWVSLLERSALIILLQPTENNLNKRLIKSHKIYFLDTGLASRLQGWTNQQSMLLSPQAGNLFETLVLAEIYKLMKNTGKNWRLSVWRTKEGEEVDFVIENDRGDVLALDAKIGVQSVRPQELPTAFKKSFPKAQEIILVTSGGNKQYIRPNCLQLPIADLYNHLYQF